MQPPRPHSLMPCLDAVGYHLTRHGHSFAAWDLRVEARNGDAITLEAVQLAEAQAFIACLNKMLLHQTPLADGTTTPDVSCAGKDLSDRPEPSPPAGEPPTDPGSSQRTDPPSAGPGPAAAREPHASGGWVPWTGTQIGTATVAAGEYLLPFLPPGGICLGGEWIVPPVDGPPAARERGRQYETDQVPVPAATHQRSATVHVPPGAAISVTCTCRPIAGGAPADDPNCRIHHGAPTVYVFDGR